MSFQTATTSLTPGTLAFNRASTPRFKVSWDMGQEPQAPMSLTFNNRHNDNDSDYDGEQQKRKQCQIEVGYVAI